MAVAVQDLIHNVTGQTFAFDAPFRPSSVTSVSVLAWNAGDDATAESATTGTASIDGVNTTFDAASGLSQSNPKTCNLTATTSIAVDDAAFPGRNRRYLAVNALNEYEWVEVVGISSGASVQARTPLQNDYASSDTFQGTRITISVLDAWIQNDAKITDSVDPNPGYRVKWVWVGTPPGGASQTFTHYTYVDVVRQPGSQHGVTTADMDRFTLWSPILPEDHRQDGGRALINEAYDDVKLRLLAANVPDQQLRNSEALAQAVKYGARMLLYRWRYDASSDAERLESYEESKREYQNVLNSLFLLTSTASRGVDATGAGAKTSPIGLWSR